MTNTNQIVNTLIIVDSYANDNTILLLDNNVSCFFFCPLFSRVLFTESADSLKSTSSSGWVL